uniref:RING-type domain-containing protein n=1 Tax=Macrostomum lignano TaxID=282301 RepID=A0A1I8HU44_9PLAT
ALPLACESKTCRSGGPGSRVHSTCFSAECAHLSGGRPIRLCEECHGHRHSHAGRQHVTQTPLPDIWDCPVELQQYMLESIVSLILEAQVPKVKTYSKEKGDEDNWYCLPEDAYPDNLSDKDRKILSIYGVILIVEKCKPRETVSIEILGRILAALFLWFDNTKLAEDSKDRLQDTLESIKSEYVTKWLNEVYRLHLEIVLSVLLPHPPDYARVGGYWNLSSSRTDIIQEGLGRLLSLVQYDCIITFDVWNYTMPFWLEAIRTEVPPEELPRLSMVMRKLYDLHSGPFPCMASKLFNFAAERFDQTTVAVQDQVLSWLRILTDLRVPIQILELLPMFRKGVESLLNPGAAAAAAVAAAAELDEDRDVNTRPDDAAAGATGGSASSQTSAPLPGAATASASSAGYRALPCFIEMLRISLQHLVDERDLPTVLECPPSRGWDLNNETSKQLMGLLLLMLSGVWDGKHSCRNDSAAVDCQFCRECRQWHQYAACVLKFIAPAKPKRLPVKDLPEVTPQQPPTSQASGTSDDRRSSKTSQSQAPAETAVEASVTVLTSASAPGGASGSGGAAASTSAASTSAGSGRGAGSGGAAPPSWEAFPMDENCLPEEDETKADDEPSGSADDQQEPAFADAHLAVHLRLVRALLKELESHTDMEVTLSILSSLSYLCLHCHALYKAQEENKDFVQFVLKYQFIPTLWKLLKAENSALAGGLVSLLLHCLALHSGAEVFWSILEREFTSDSWRTRFDAVEKVTVICREMSSDCPKASYIVVTSLAHAFSNLIGSLDDINTAVAQRAQLYLETVKQSSLRCMIQCLEAQFDSVINDRTLILQRIYQLSCALKDAPVLTWDFFMARFDALSLEAQLDLESRGDITCATDISGNSNRDSEAFMRKYNRARFAVARTDSVRSVSSSAFVKPPYRRACSVPMHLLSRPGKATAAGHKDVPKDKQYSRQASAPLFSVGRRKSKNALGAISSFVLSGGQFREFTDEESNFAAQLQRALDLEGGDRETLHQLVALLLHFMANLDLATQSDDRQNTKTQSLVLRHLNTLLGYNQADKTFSVPPYKLRSLTVFHAFIGGISPVLDCNFEVGNNVLHVALAVLQYAPSPQRYASDNQPPDYSLCLLEPYTRNHWLNALLIILYKYQYNSPNFASIMEVLVKIAINTIDAQVHVCKENAEEAFEPPASHSHRPRARTLFVGLESDASTVSIGDIDTIQENESPTLSPLTEAPTFAAASSSRSSRPPFYKPRTKPDADGSDLKFTRMLASPAAGRCSTLFDASPGDTVTTVW